MITLETLELKESATINQRLFDWGITRYDRHTLPNIIRCYNENHIEQCQILTRSHTKNEDGPDAYAQQLLKQHHMNYAVLRFSDSEDQALLYNKNGVFIAEIADPTPDDQRGVRYQVQDLILQR